MTGNLREWRTWFWKSWQLTSLRVLKMFCNSPFETPPVHDPAEGSCHLILHQSLNSFIFMYLIPFRKKISTPLQAFLDGRELIWPKAGGCVLCVCMFALKSCFRNQSTEESLPSCGHGLRGLGK